MRWLAAVGRLLPGPSPSSRRCAASITRSFIGHTWAARNRDAKCSARERTRSPGFAKPSAAEADAHTVRQAHATLEARGYRCRRRAARRDSEWNALTQGPQGIPLSMTRRSPTDIEAERRVF